MAADQVFGRIEKVLRKKEIIVCPTQYHDIFKQFCQVKTYENDFKVYNIKEACKSIINPKGFKLTEQKMLLYEKGKKTIGVSQNYTDDYVYFKIIKKNSRIELLGTLEILKKQNHVKPPKQKDIKNLMRFFTVPTTTSFYEDIFKSHEFDSIEDSALNEEGACIYSEDTSY
ncbi:unnamed protein product [Macrosiphum euphorbiae]|uniref:Uncharacterized protein n=1 Tax=Macrosiphum euphorbiae TaxID=13131 RepID=A0AAV0W5W6_9HEMI|nr:unnamed protein product [Macrosiphum euphorbiae]CAI6351162.1 unnamed protein product [Macrosiphum euphorbiae]